MQTRPRWAPKHATRASPCNPPLQSGTKEPRRSSPARVPETGRAQNERPRSAVAAGVRTPRSPTQGPTRHSPVQTPGSAGRRGPLLLGLCTRRPDLNFLRPLFPAAAGQEPRPRARSHRSGGAARSTLRGAGTPAPPSAGQRAPPPSLCPRGTGGRCRGGSSRCSRWGCHYQHRPARSASRPNVVIRRVAASLGTSAAELLHIERPPIPGPPRPAARGPRPRPLSSRDGGGGGPAASLRGARRPRPSGWQHLVLPERYRCRLASAHRGRLRAASPPPAAHACDLQGGASWTRRTGPARLGACTAAPPAPARAPGSCSGPARSGPSRTRPRLGLGPSPSQTKRKRSRGVWLDKRPTTRSYL